MLTSPPVPSRTHDGIRGNADACALDPNKTRAPVDHHGLVEPYGLRCAAVIGRASREVVANPHVG